MHNINLSTPRTKHIRSNVVVPAKLKIHTTRPANHFCSHCSSVQLRDSNWKWFFFHYTRFFTWQETFLLIQSKKRNRIFAPVCPSAIFTVYWTNLFTFNFYLPYRMLFSFVLIYWKKRTLLLIEFFYNFLQVNTA